MQGDLRAPSERECPGWYPRGRGGCEKNFRKNVTPRTPRRPRQGSAAGLGAGRRQTKRLLRTVGTDGLPRSARQACRHLFRPLLRFLIAPSRGGADLLRKVPTGNREVRPRQEKARLRSRSRSLPEIARRDFFVTPPPRLPPSVSSTLCLRLRLHIFVGMLFSDAWMLVTVFFGYLRFWLPVRFFLANGGPVRPSNIRSPGRGHANLELRAQGGRVGRQARIRQLLVWWSCWWARPAAEQGRPFFPADSPPGDPIGHHEGQRYGRWPMERPTSVHCFNPRRSRGAVRLVRLLRTSPCGVSGRATGRVELLGQRPVTRGPPACNASRHDVQVAWT